MRLLYRAEHLFDAQMVQNLLQQHGLRGWVEGAALTGAAGELPVHDVVRVMVHDDDCAAAQALLRDWESGSFTLPADGDTPQSPPLQPNHSHDSSCDMSGGSADSSADGIPDTTSMSGMFGFVRKRCLMALLLVVLSIVAGVLRSIFFR